MSWRTHGKTIAMALATLVMAGVATYRDVVADGNVSPSEWVTVVIAGFATVTIYLSANVSGFEKAKTIVSAVMLVLNLLVSMIVGGLTTDEIMLLTVHFLGALGVAGAPAVKHIDQRRVVAR